MNPENGQTHGFELLEPPSPVPLLPQHALWPWLLGGGVALLFLIAAVFFLTRKKVRAVDPKALREAAFRDACAALSEAAAPDAREAATISSLVIRKYLCSAAGDPALFETHEEFVSRHGALAVLTNEARSAASSGFTRLAALKYAPEIPQAEPAHVIAESRALLETLHRGFAA
jgi:hypothetical protein